MVLAVIASLVIALLVVLSAPTDLTLPERSPEQGGAAKTGGADDPGHLRRGAGIPGRIEGRVLCGGEAVVADLTLLLHRDFPRQTCRRGETDRAGSFVFPGVPPGLHEITAVSLAGVGVRTAVEVLAGVDLVTIELTLPTGAHTLTGRCVRADGRPFRGEAQINFDGRQDPLIVATGKDGRFTVAGLPAGWISFRFRSEAGLDAEARGIELPHEDEVLFVVDEGAEKIRGRVVDAKSGKAVAGAVVRIDGELPGEHPFHFRTVTAADGSFTAAVPLYDGRIDRLSVSAEGYLDWRLLQLLPANPIEVRLDPAALLTVRTVSSHDGEPVPFLPVMLVFENMIQSTLLGNADGRVTFSVRPELWHSLFSWGHGFGTDDGEESEGECYVRLDPGERREMDLPVRRLAMIMGRVTTSSGEPVDRAHVWSDSTVDVRDGRFTIRNVLPGEFRLHAKRDGLQSRVVRGTLAPGAVLQVDLALPPGAWADVEVFAEDTGEPVEGAEVSLYDLGYPGQTDRQGRILLGPFQEVKTNLQVRSQRYLPAFEHLEFKAGKITRVPILLKRGQSISGRVVFGDGTAAPGIEVRSGRQVAIAAEEGSFVLRGLASGEPSVSVAVTDEAGREYSCRRNVVAGTSGVILVLKPDEDPPARSIDLLVTDTDDHPVPCADFRLHAVNANGSKVWGDRGTISAGHGRGYLNAAAAEVTIHVSNARTPTGLPLPLADSIFGPYPVEAGRIEVTLPGELAISGWVVGPSGERLSRAEISARVRGSRGPEDRFIFSRKVRTGEDGTFRVGGLGPGPVEIVVSGPSGLEGSEPVVVPAGTRDVEVEFAPPLPFVVTVCDSRGRPVKGARVAAWSPDRVERGGFGFGSRRNVTNVTDGAGRAQLQHLHPPATYVLTVEPPVAATDLGSVRIDGFRPGNTAVTLPPGFSISGKVLRTDGTPWSGPPEKFFAYCKERGWTKVEVGRSGEFEVNGFAAGHVALAFRPDAGAPSRVPTAHPDQLEWPVTWVGAGDREIDFWVPGR